MIYLGSMIVASLSLLAWGLYDLRRFSDFAHRRQIAGCIAASYVLLAGAMVHLRGEYREKLTLQRSSTNGSRIAFDNRIEHTERDQIPDPPSFSATTKAGHVVTVSSGRSLSAGTGHDRRSPDGVRYILRGLDRANGSSSAGFDLLQRCASATSEPATSAEF